MSDSLKQHRFIIMLLVIGAIVIGLTAAPYTIQIEKNTSTAQDEPDVTYTLETRVGGDPAMAFVGVGGDIDGLANPDLHAQVGDVVAIRVINAQPVLHDLAVEAFDAYSGELVDEGDEATVVFTVTEAGTFDYICSIPGHEAAGMAGLLIVSEADGEAASDADGEADEHDEGDSSMADEHEAVDWVIRHPADVPESVGDRDATTVEITLVAEEVTAQLADGTNFHFFTFDGTVPGPMLRVREGDTVEITIVTAEDSHFPHSIDLHAVTGPGGGAVYTQTNPGEETVFTFKALQPGLYVYHCATPSVAHHIANGMYGLILVEPEGGLPPVDREFYVMQGEFYTEQPFGTSGLVDFSHDKMLAEQPTYYTFNGAAGALTMDEYALRANVGETVRIYFGVGGPNATSSFHVIGEIFDRVYDQASLTSPPLTDVQTTTVPPGGATMVEFGVEVPGRYILVDHALSRLELGLAGFLYVEGEEDPSIYQGAALTEGSGH